MKNFTFITMVACILALNTLMVHSQTMHEPNTNSVCLLENFQLKLPPTDEVNSIFSEDFSSGTFPPAGWTIVGDGQTNWSAENTSSAGGTPPEAVFYYEPIFMGNSRLVTSTISTSGYTSLLLSFKHRLDDAGGPGNYTLFVETTSDGGTTWNEVWSLLDPGSTVGPEIKYLIIDNDDVGSDNFQIAFRFDGDSEDLNLWNIDDVMVEEALQYDAKALEILIPSQVAADDVVIPSGIVQNIGYEAITFDVNFTIEEQGGASVYNEDISVTNLAPFESQTLVFPDWVPDEGTYDCMLTTNLAGDANPDNDQVNKTIEAITGAFDFKPLYEEFTSSTCGPCAYANPILDAVLNANPETHSLIKYQMNWPGNGDPYYTEEGGVRRDYYSVFGVPDLFIDGNQFPPGDMTQAIYDLYQGLITGMSIEVSAEIDDDYNLTVNTNIDVSYNYDAGLKAHIVVVEKETVGNVGTNGENEFNNVMLKMLPNAAGTTLPALTPGNTETISQLYPMDLTFMEEPNDLAIIVFVQDDTDKSIIQSEQIDVEGTFESYEVTFIVSDANGNPVNNAEIFLESQGYQYTNSTGQTVFEVVFPGNYGYEVTAVGLLGTSGSLEVADQDVTENVTLEIPDYYFFEPFDTGVPASWTSHVTSPDMVYWYDGEVLLFDQTPDTYPIMLISPEINIEPVLTLYFDAGQQSNNPTLLFGTVTDPDDPSTFELVETFNPGEPMETYSIDLTQITSTDVYFAWQLQESQGSWVVIDNVIIYAESSDSYKVTFNVADSEGNGVENAEVYVSGQGSLITNEYGEVIFQNVYPGSYNYNVVAETLIPYEGNITIVDEDVTENVVLEDYFIYEGFDTEIPNDWTVHYTYPDNLYWYNDWVTFFNQTGNANPLILVTPLLYLEGLTSVIIEIGSGTYNPDLVVGTLSDPDDPDSFTPLETFPISGTWGFITVDLTNYTGTDSYLGFKLEGVPFSYFFISNIGFTGSMNTSIFEDNFESYNAGEQLACQNPADWTTWSNDPCSAEDPYITTDQAFSSNNSAEITGTNDLVKVIENYTSGYYSISFKMYVPNGHDGYFNTLQEFNGTNSQWGMQVYFDAGGAGSIDGGGTAAATFSFNYDEWMDIEVKVDLNADWAEFYHNNYYIHGWVWSSGTGGTGTLNQLGGSNFYAWEGANGSPLYYFDDYKIEEAIALEAPTNLIATVIDDNDVELTWDAPFVQLDFFEGFEGNTYPPDGWLKMNFDEGDGWALLEAGTTPLPGWSYGSATSCPNGGDYQVFATWLTGGASSNDQWFVTPQITVQSGYILDFWLDNHFDFEMEYIEILISTTIQDDTSAFNIVVDEIEYPVGSPTGWIQYTYDLENFVGAGTPIYIAFREKVPDNYNSGAISLDNIFVGEADKLYAFGTQNEEETFDYSSDLMQYFAVTDMCKNSKDLIGYNVYRDGDLIAEEISETTYTDYDLLPNTYSFDVKAVYDEGISAGAGPAEATIEGGTDRDIVILEIGTGTWCTFCPGAAMGADEMVENGHAIGVIEYHGGDDYETSESGSRLDNFYGITGYPTAWFDGVITHVGGNSTTSLYETYLGYYEQRVDKVSLFTMDAEVLNTGGTSWDVMVEAEMIYPYPGDDVVLQAVLIESHIPESWLNQTEVNFVCRDMLPDQFGTEMDFAANPIQTVTLEMDVPASYEIANCEVVVFLQDNQSKEILQGTKAALFVSVGEQTSDNSCNIYPNPADEYIIIESNTEIGHIKIFNQTGQVVINNSYDNNIYRLDVSNLKSGLYLIQLESSKSMVSKRMIIK